MFSRAFLIIVDEETFLVGAETASDVARVVLLVFDLFLVYQLSIFFVTPCSSLLNAKGRSYPALILSCWEDEVSLQLWLSGLFELLTFFSVFISKCVFVWTVYLLSIIIGDYFLNKVLDLIVLLLIHSTNTKNRKQTEKVLRSRIRLGCISEQLMQNAFQDHSVVSADSALGFPL